MLLPSRILWLLSLSKDPNGGTKMLLPRRILNEDAASEESTSTLEVKLLPSRILLLLSSNTSTFEMKLLPSRILLLLSSNTSTFEALLPPSRLLLFLS